ncbi:MAG: hypothetical protein ING29_13010 [Azospirillum sp.]|nr:hypothetical protein [Azospirillum sp.]
MTDDTDQDWYARYRREVEAAHWQRKFSELVAEIQFKHGPIDPRASVFLAPPWTT